MLHRAADEKAGVGVVAMNLKILFVGAAFGRGIQRGGVDRQLPVGVEHLDRAEMIGGRGMIEQDQMQDGF
jgi:hypothetical protein